MTTDGDINANDFSCYQAHIRAHMQAISSIAMPFRAVGIRGSWLIRLPDGREMMSSPSNIAAMVEKSVWRTAAWGC